MSKIEVKDRRFVFNEPVEFDDIYEDTVRLIIDMYPKTADLIDAMSDQSFDALCIDFREFIIELAKEQGKYIEVER